MTKHGKNTELGDVDIDIHTRTTERRSNLDRSEHEHDHGTKAEDASSPVIDINTSSPPHGSSKPPTNASKPKSNGSKQAKSPSPASTTTPLRTLDPTPNPTPSATIKTIRSTNRTSRHTKPKMNASISTSTSTPPPLPPSSSSAPPSNRLFPIAFSLAQKYDDQNVGLREVAVAAASGGAGEVKTKFQGPVEVSEMVVREQQRSFIFTRFCTTLWSSVLVFAVYLVTLESVLSVALCVGLTLYWYDVNKTDETWDGSNMNWIVLGFAVVTPLTVTITLAFQRRERALFEISRIRSLCFQTYLAHAVWDWTSGLGRNHAMNHDQWLKHTDEVLEQLVGIGDELSRFLTLPTSSRSYHRMLKSGRRKAADIVEVAYKLLDSFHTQRMVKLTKLTEKLKSHGLAATEVSRLRQYERFIGEAIENLRMIKMYRTPQALRSFGRIFTLILPAFYSPAFAHLAMDLQSITMGIMFAILTPLVLTALFETMQIIEDPFVGWVSLDGIDVNEEMQILHFHQLISARSSLFPDAEPFEMRSKAAILTLGLDLNSTERLKKEAHSRKASDMSCMTLDGSHRVSHYTVDAMSEKPDMSSSSRSHKKGMSSNGGSRHDRNLF